METPPNLKELQNKIVALVKDYEARCDWRIESIEFDGHQEPLIICRKLEPVTMQSEKYDTTYFSNPLNPRNLSTASYTVPLYKEYNTYQSTIITPVTPKKITFWQRFKKWISNG